MMSVEQFTSFLAWCTLINYGILVIWFFMFIKAHDWMYVTSGRLFKLSMDEFDKIHYAAMAFFKLAWVLLNLVPYIAMKMIF
ncbi:DUF6868 family protein [Aliiglaciecola sp. LCG003]|uniref:DUF6868 family protein n=1 Tax=Aliiglaciecola sp. LCG003 TaxID=3053655 RepID=UPI002574250A|nr:hypothetical protein [Aliiglaciecola sp. LCG003]WJG10726.1 hypothetical protein QR722_06705 [Aliiglaciecola sp. LCG003]